MSATAKTSKASAPPAKIKNQIKSASRLGGNAGGDRPGAGRPKGAKNKKTRALQEAIESSGETPLQFMLRVMRGEACPPNADPKVKAVFAGLQFEAAKAAAPYVHSRLSSVEMSNPPPANGKDGKLPNDPVDASKVYKDLMG